MREANGSSRKEDGVSRYKLFDRDKIELKQLRERGHQLQASECWHLDADFKTFVHPEFPDLVDSIAAARDAFLTLQQVQTPEFQLRSSKFTAG